MNDFREHPATYTLSACWVLVYVAMTVHQGGMALGGGMNFGRISTQTTHVFGDLTAQDVINGQVWRTVTATFIHFSLLHLILNMTCLISLGRLLESWYGKWQMLAVYVAIGALGNGLAVLGRIVLDSGIRTPCAGGSSVMFGFVALIAVVGWRSRTRFGDYVRKQMLGKLLVFGVVVGFVGRGVLDNFGHGGGAAAGALVGFSHRLLVRSVDRRLSPILGVIALAILSACLMAQVVSNRVESTAPKAATQASSYYKDVRSSISMFETLATYAALNPGSLTGESLIEVRKQLDITARRVGEAMDTHFGGKAPAPFLLWRAYLSAAALRFPTPEERKEFEALSVSVVADAENRLSMEMQSAGTDR